MTRRHRLIRIFNGIWKQNIHSTGLGKGIPWAEHGPETSAVLHTRSCFACCLSVVKKEAGSLNSNQLQRWECYSWTEGSLPHESIVETTVGKIIKGLTAVLVNHLLFNQNVSCISCSQVAWIPKFLCLLQYIVAKPVIRN